MQDVLCYWRVKLFNVKLKNGAVNPPFNKAVSANVAKIFFRVINIHFSKSHRLHKIFSSNTVRVSYSCMQNMYKIYKEYNSNITSTPCNQLTLCNCRVKEEFPMDGKCQTLDAVYDCRFTSSEPRRIYFKLAEGNGRKGIIIIKSHSTTNYIHMRRYF